MDDSFVVVRLRTVIDHEHRRLVLGVIGCRDGRKKASSTPGDFRTSQDESHSLFFQHGVPRSTGNIFNIYRLPIKSDAVMATAKPCWSPGDSTGSLTNPGHGRLSSPATNRNEDMR